MDRWENLLMIKRAVKWLNIDVHWATIHRLRHLNIVAKGSILVLQILGLIKLTLLNEIWSLLLVNYL